MHRTQIFVSAGYTIILYTARRVRTEVTLLFSNEYRIENVFVTSTLNRNICTTCI